MKVRRTVAAAVAATLLPLASLHASSPTTLGAVAATPATPKVATPGQDVLDAFDIHRGVVFTLANPTIDEFGRTHIAVPDPQGGNALHLMLRPFSVRGEDFTLVAFNEKGEPTTVEAAEPSTVRGNVIGDAGARVAGAFTDGRLTLSIRFADGRRYFVDSLAFSVAGVAMNQHIVYDAEDRVETGAHCGVSDGKGHGGIHHHGGQGGEGGDGGVAGGGGGGLFCDTQIVIDCDFPYFNANGSSIDQTATRAETIINIVNDQYEPQVGIRHLITGIVVRNTAAADPYVSNLLCVAPDLLAEVGAYWTNVQGAPFAAITRDMVHLFTGRVDPTSGIIGCAYIGDVCLNATDFIAHGASRAAWTSNTAFVTDLIAHELGHNWGGEHCTCSSPPSTMNAFLTGANTFLNSPSIAEITSWRNSHSTCLNCNGTAIDGCGDPLAGSAWVAHASRFANQSSCCARICASDPFCCNTEWDAACASAARFICAGCGNGSTGSQYVARTNPGCSDSSCCATICARDAYCCDVEWDSFCVNQAESLCRVGLVCSDARLINTSISASLQYNTAIDPTSSDESSCGENDIYAIWFRYVPTCSGMSTLSTCTEFAEGQVTMTAFSACGGTQITCSATDTNCGFGNGGVEIRFAALAGQSYLIRVSASNGGRVAGGISVACDAVCGVGGSCAVTGSGPGCSNASCCVNVCTVDPFCCDNTWDNICANRAQDVCFPAGDLNFDGVVNAADLAILLGGWGAGGVSDINSDGITNAADLSALLSSWG